jgi:hypothetical protein
MRNKFFVQLGGDEIFTTDQEILARIEEIEKRMERMETTLENVNSILKLHSFFIFIVQMDNKNSNYKFNSF